MTLLFDEIAVSARPRAMPPPPRPLPPDALALENDLRRRIEGEVRFDDGSRALYATDASNYRQVPVGVVIPRSTEDVIATVAACRERGVPVLARGGGTSLAGQCCNVALVIDFSKFLHRILEIDPQGRRARVQPGTILDDLRHAATAHGLTFGPDPSTHNRCTLGGMIGNNSCGVHSVMAGKTVDNVEELDVLTYDGLRLKVGPTSDEELARIVRAGGRRGEIYRRLRDLRDRSAGLIRQRFPKIPRRVSGYNLDELLPENGFNVARALVGTEGTCVTVLEATLRLIHNPSCRVLLALGYPDVYTAADHVPEILEHRPIGLEGMDDRLARAIRLKHLHEENLDLLPAGHGWLLVELGGETKDEARARAEAVMDALRARSDAPSLRLVDDELDQRRLWEIREAGLGATAHLPGAAPTWPGWEDSAVAPEKLGGYLRDLRALFKKYGYECSLYGHFGQGCVHVSIDFDLETHDGIRKYRSFLDDASDLVMRYGGSFSGEHGDGQARGVLLPKMYGEELRDAFREFKSIWDPEWRMNPGKVIDAAEPTDNLRLGAHWAPWTPETAFVYPDDAVSFARVSLRCVGVGLCRRADGGTMCPSFMVTREEKHSTRGRARLLFEMLNREVIGRDGWDDAAVKESLDLCLACKGCKGDCPVQVDMATYKAEFLSHYYKRHPRPRSAWAFGLIHWWARLAELAPEIVNFATHAPGLRDLAKAVAGVAPEREIPAFATWTFRDWFARRAPRNPEGKKVLLWPDTFNDHFHPEVLRSAVTVLENAGFRVAIPEPVLCCGRPLYDYGLLGLAQRLLRRILDTLRDDIRAGTPVVGLEPSCAATFRDELINFFPRDEDARRLAGQTFLLPDFLVRETPEESLPRLHRKAVVHAHCHHGAIFKTDGERELLKRLGLDFELLDSGCCGMAGSFGFESGEQYDVSIRCGERVLLPRVREAPRDALVIADGFSCREQIAQGTGRRALHLAQVLEMAWDQGPEGPPGDLPENQIRREGPHRLSAGTAGLALLGAGLAGWLAGSLLGGTDWDRRRPRRATSSSQKRRDGHGRDSPRDR
jgi:FAD/FMN-containing dehydrogenase/Fe-S oxidoreductase